MTISDLALCLLDLPGRDYFQLKRIDFHSLDETTEQSFAPPPTSKSESATTAAPMQSFTVASRMSRNNLSEQARMDALVESLRKIRINHEKPKSGRVIRGA